MIETNNQFISLACRHCADDHQPEVLQRHTKRLYLIVHFSPLALVDSGKDLADQNRSLLKPFVASR